MSEIIDAGTHYEGWIANSIESQYTQAMDGMFAQWYATHPTNLNPDLQAPPEADSASSYGDGCVPNKWGVA